MLDLILFLIFVFLACGFGYLQNSTLENIRAESNQKTHSTHAKDSNFERDSQEDSEGDGLMLFDDTMFPPENF